MSQRPGWEESSLQPRKDLMSCSLNIPLLRDLQVPEFLLQEKHAVFQCASQRYHFHIRCPEILFPSEAHPVTLSLLETVPELVCRCLVQLPSGDLSSWSVASLLADAMQLPRPPQQEGTLLQVLHYRHVEKILVDFRATLYMYGSPRVERFRPAIDVVLGRMISERQAALESVRSEKFRSSLLKDSSDAGTLALVGLHGDALHAVRPTRVDGILVAHETDLSLRQEQRDLFAGIYRGVMPLVLADRVHEWRAPRPGDTTGRCQVVPLQESDTPTIQEMALSLWEPTSEGDMRSLSCALEAARRL